MTAPRTTISLEITSDTICPWCFIAYKHIQTAIEQVKKNNLAVDFDIHFLPFQLDTNLPPSPGYNKREWYTVRLGGRIKGVEEQMIARGKADGVNLWCVLLLQVEATKG